MLMMALWMSGCTRSGMGGDCQEAADCRDGGSCLKGVCSAYECGQDTDCEGDWQCEDIASVQVCALAYTDDSDCPGELGCSTIDGEDSEETEAFCL